MLVRDAHRCAYCGRRASTLDHVQPRSRGGGGHLAEHGRRLRPCNHRKADRTPEQAGMAPLITPFEPTPEATLMQALGVSLDELPDWLPLPAAEPARRGRRCRGPPGGRAAGRPDASAGRDGREAVAAVV